MFFGCDEKSEVWYHPEVNVFCIYHHGNMFNPPRVERDDGKCLIFRRPSKRLGFVKIGDL